MNKLKIIYKCITNHDLAPGFKDMTLGVKGYLILTFIGLILGFIEEHFLHIDVLIYVLAVPVFLFISLPLVHMSLGNNFKKYYEQFPYFYYHILVIEVIFLYSHRWGYLSSIGISSLEFYNLIEYSSYILGIIVFIVFNIPTFYEIICVFYNNLKKNE